MQFINTPHRHVNVWNIRDRVVVLYLELLLELVIRAPSVGGCFTHLAMFSIFHKMSVWEAKQQTNIEEIKRLELFFMVLNNDTFRFTYPPFIQSVYMYLVFHINACALNSFHTVILNIKCTKHFMSITPYPLHW